MISDLLNAHLGPCQMVLQNQDEIQIPDDLFYQVSMGADIGNMPPESLMTIGGLRAEAEPTQKAFMSPGDFAVVLGKDRLPIVLGVLMGLINSEGQDHGLLPGFS